MSVVESTSKSQVRIHALTASRALSKAWERKLTSICVLKDYVGTCIKRQKQRGKLLNLPQLKFVLARMKYLADPVT